MKMRYTAMSTTLTMSVSTMALPTLRCAFSGSPRAEADADIGAAAVADHGGDGERDDRQWEHDAVGRVAVGTEIARVGDEELVDDVVQRADEQRQDAWQREFAHQRADRLLGEKGIGLGFVHACLRFSAQRQKKRHTPRVCLQTRKPTHTTLAYRFVSECCASVYRAFKPDLKFYGSYYTSPRPKKQAPRMPGRGRIKCGRCCCAARCDPCFSYFSACRFFRRFSRAFLRLAFHFCQSRACFSFARV